MSQGACNRVMLISHGATFGGGGEIAFDELVQSLRTHAPSVSLLAVSPKKGVIADRARSNGAEVAFIAQPRWADFGKCGTRYWARSLLLGAVTLVQTSMTGLDGMEADRADAPLAPAATANVKTMTMANMNLFTPLPLCRC